MAPLRVACAFWSLLSLLVASSADDILISETSDDSWLGATVDLLQRDLSLRNHISAADNITAQEEPYKLPAFHPPSLFCWAVVMREEGTLEQVRKQMLGCDSYVLLSNFSDPDRNVVKIYEDMELGPPYVDEWGFERANCTEMFRTAWKYLAQTTAEKPFDWYVKVDADTFFRPRKLFPMLLQFDPNDVMTVAAAGRTQPRGSLEAVTRGAVHSPKPFHDVTPQELGGAHAWCEDEWLAKAILTVGGQVPGASLSEMGAQTGYECIGYLLNLYSCMSGLELCCGVSWESLNITSPKDLASFDKSSVKIRRDIFVKDYMSTDGVCLSKNIAAIHPVKDVQMYEELQQLDEDANRSEASWF
jgi:hypothetical protein